MFYSLFSYIIHYSVCVCVCFLFVCCVRYQGRRLQWAHAHQRCVLTARFSKGKKELEVSLFQVCACVLNLFLVICLKSYCISRLFNVRSRHTLFQACYYAIFWLIAFLICIVLCVRIFHIFTQRIFNSFIFLYSLFFVLLGIFSTLVVCSCMFSVLCWLRNTVQLSFHFKNDITLSYLTFTSTLTLPIILFFLHSSMYSLSLLSISYPLIFIFIISYHSIFITFCYLIFIILIISSIKSYYLSSLYLSNIFTLQIISSNL